jgi:hypothetical protein
VACRSRTTADPVSWANAASGSPRVLRLSCRRFPDFRYRSCSAYKKEAPRSPGTPLSNFRRNHGRKVGLG